MLTALTAALAASLAASFGAAVEWPSSFFDLRTSTLAELVSHPSPLAPLDLLTFTVVVFTVVWLLLFEPPDGAAVDAGLPVLLALGFEVEAATTAAAAPAAAAFLLAHLHGGSPSLLASLLTSLTALAAAFAAFLATFGLPVLPPDGAAVLAAFTAAAAPAAAAAATFLGAEVE